MNFVFTFYSSMNPEKVSHVIASQKYSLFKSFVTIYTTVQKFGVSNFFPFFERN